jgi:hypothetical protein
MSNTYNMIGSLSTLKSRLRDNDIDDFKSLKELMDFQSSYAAKRQQLIAEHERLIEQEQAVLKAALEQLEEAIATQKQQTEAALSAEIETIKQQIGVPVNWSSTNILNGLLAYFQQWQYKRQLRSKESRFIEEINKSVSELVASHQHKSTRFQFITAQFAEAVKQSAQSTLFELERRKAVIDSLNSFIYGAIGEQKVVKALEKLSDEYYLINDFTLHFKPAIYNRQENDHIQSIQIDHLLVGPSGVFIIETKNWSEQSLANINLRSPIEQIRRNSFALFVLLNNESGNYQIQLSEHHWGNQKISIKNLLVLINTKPKEEFQFVKILTLSELLGYINYFKPLYSSTETQRIAEFLLKLNDHKIINSK